MSVRLFQSRLVASVTLLAEPIVYNPPVLVMKQVCVAPQLTDFMRMPRSVFFFFMSRIFLALQVKRVEVREGCESL